MRECYKYLWVLVWSGGIRSPLTNSEWVVSMVLFETRTRLAIRVLTTAVLLK